MRRGRGDQPSQNKRRGWVGCMFNEEEGCVHYAGMARCTMSP